MDRQPLGRMGEEAACAYLAAAGYTIIRRNFHCREGELDIVATKSGTMIFAEVKARRGSYFGSPAEAVTWRKRRRIIAAALRYLEQHGGHGGPLRFDVIAVHASEAPPRVEHIPDAFGRE